MPEENSLTSEEIREELKRRLSIAREALFLVRLDSQLRPKGDLSTDTKNKVDEAFDLLA